MTRLRKFSAVYNRDKLSKLIDFGGMRFGPLMPTDLDAYIDFKGQAWVLIEVKEEGAPWPRGQMIALERLASDLMQTGKPVVAIRAIYRELDINGDIDLGTCIVHSYMERPLKSWQGAWRTLDENPDNTVRDLVETFLNLWGIKID